MCCADVGAPVVAQAPWDAGTVSLLTYDADHVLRPEVGHRDAQRHLVQAHLPALRHDTHVAAAAQQPSGLSCRRHIHDNFAIRGTPWYDA